MTLQYIDDSRVADTLGLEDAIVCVDRAFRLLASGRAVNAVRQRASAGSATINVMWAIAPSEGVLGVKEYPTVAGSSRGAVLTLVLHDVATGQILGVFQADHLGQLRTAAASAVATRALARPDGEVLSVFGTGFQARWQVRAIALVMPALRSVRVVGRTPSRRDLLIRQLRADLDISVDAAQAREAAETADVIVTATSSVDPILMGAWVRPGTHVNAIGSNVAHHRELDREVLERADVLAVDDPLVAAQECGDLISNGIDMDRATPLGEILLGLAAGRANVDAITVFESQGLALQDVLCAAHVISELKAAEPASATGPGGSSC